ncbi:putative defense protein 3 [Dreissena polymorpha]|uniref:Reelin domain-containing protein n=1 Tax=Dreissena polymorpha TaxID=45954 RepID=A0A9D4L8C1_DREPO|nr:putative defense protein 3 [Dreissena polymorpha]KAH3853897.1 hypothetical protein DPMN_096433 [Dreissena polymorpha]
MILQLIVLMGVLRGVAGYSSGAPPGQCNLMYPGHGVPAQPGPAPYRIEVSDNSFGCPTDNITVSLVGQGPAVFRGFFCQPRPSPNVFYTSGVISAPPSASDMKDPCGEGRSLTHTLGRINKQKVTFSWTPTIAQPVYIVCSVVATYNTFWVKLTSEVINYVQKDCTTRQTTISPQTQTTTPITTPAVRPVSTTTKRPVVPEVATTTVATTTAAPVTRSTSGQTDGSAGIIVGNTTSNDPKNSVRSATCITEIVFAAVTITIALVF